MYSKPTLNAMPLVTAASCCTEYWSAQAGPLRVCVKQITIGE